jgi:hypothetical protein
MDLIDIMISESSANGKGQISVLRLESVLRLQVGLEMRLAKKKK